VFHVKHDASLGKALEELGVTASPRAAAALLEYEGLLLERALPLGFVSEADRAEVRSRHVLDCVRAAPLIPPGLVADLGSGAGLPGVVAAIARPDVTVHLIEPKRRRLAFLELVVERLELGNAVPVGRPVEEVRGSYDGALARAFADATRSWRVAEPLLRPSGPLIYFAGRGFRSAEVGVEGIRLQEVPAPPLLERAGPLVIMSRQ
jgi:16S rRNA (guanine527-N7)-methyltransferase